MGLTASAGHFLRKPSVLPWVLIVILLLGIAIYVVFAYEKTATLIGAIGSGAPLLIFDKALTTTLGGIVVLAFGIPYAIAALRFNVRTYRTEVERKTAYLNLVRLSTKGMLAGLVLALGVSFFVFNPLIERYLIESSGYVRCPNQLELDRHLGEDVWVKSEAWCFDKGFRATFAFRSTVSPLDYLRHLQSKESLKTPAIGAP